MHYQRKTIQSLNLEQLSAIIILGVSYLTT